MPPQDAIRELETIGVRLDVAAAPILLLRELGGTRCLAIWIGANEAAAIVHALEGVFPPRPMTHDLLVNILDASSLEPECGQITEVVEGQFSARLKLTDQWIDLRPSDLVALAVRTGLRLECPDELLDEVGIVLEEAPGDDELEKFRQFLDAVTPEDFEGEDFSGEQDSTNP